MSFLKSIFATVIGLFIFSVVMFLLMIITIGGIASSNTESPSSISENSVLVFPVSGQIMERVPEDPFQDLFSDSEIEAIELLPTIEAIYRAKEDSNIKGIYMKQGAISGGYGALAELRQALVSFKESGKFIYSYGEYMTEQNYYLASVADEIILYPLGGLEFDGLSANVTFFKGMLDKLGIEAQIFKVGDYKSAVEPFFRKSMSDASQEQVTSFINDIYNNYITEIGVSRSLESEELKKIANLHLINTAEDALKYNLITKIDTEQGVRDLLTGQLEVESVEDMSVVSMSKYSKSAFPATTENQIAVIVAQGEIISGEGSYEEVGSKTFVQSLREVRENEDIKAVIIRVNSPGGSMLASDVIWNEIVLTKEKKPVIASMSSVAASGGYYLSMPCDTIIAQPMTITGSIGIFGILPNLEEFLEEKIGITNQSVSTGKYSNILRVSSALTDDEKAIIQNSINKGYEIFTSKAAEGRSMKIENIKKVASGRVWTGSQAQENGLVDLLGNYKYAVDIAVSMAELENKNYSLVYYPEMKNKLESLMDNLSEDVKSQIIEDDLSEMRHYLKYLETMGGMKGIQARLPYMLEVQ